MPASSNVVALRPRAPVVPERRRRPIVPSGVLAMLIFVVTEVMFFAGLISAYTIAEGMSPGGWPPPGQPRLPVETTAFNTVVLVASGIALFLAGRAARATDESDVVRATGRNRVLLLAAMLTGAFFVVFQGVEWVRLIGEGLSMVVSTHAAFFYLIVGLHALHAVAALITLGWVLRRLGQGRVTASAYLCARIFWYFVVGVWPVLYTQVYL